MVTDRQDVTPEPKGPVRKPGMRRRRFYMTATLFSWKIGRLVGRKTLLLELSTY